MLARVAIVDLPPEKEGLHSSLDLHAVCIGSSAWHNYGDRTCLNTLQEATIKDLRNELADKEVALQNAQRKLFQARASRCEPLSCITVSCWPCRLSPLLQRGHSTAASQLRQYLRPRISAGSLRYVPLAAPL